jgi:hypothetical protein
MILVPIQLMPHTPPYGAGDDSRSSMRPSIAWSGAYLVRLVDHCHCARTRR